MLPPSRNQLPLAAATPLALLARATADALALAAGNARAAQEQLARVAEAATEAAIARIRATTSPPPAAPQP